GTSATSPAVILQVIPLRIDVSGSSSEINVGDSMQLGATAVDTNEQPISGLTFRWQVTGANGFNTRAAAIGTNGLLTTSGIGLITIHAQIVYTGQSAAHLPYFEGLFHVLISVPREFKLTRVLTNTTLDRAPALRPAYNSEPGINDSGQ